MLDCEFCICVFFLLVITLYRLYFITSSFQDHQNLTHLLSAISTQSKNIFTLLHYVYCKSENQSCSVRSYII